MTLSDSKALFHDSYISHTKWKFLLLLTAADEYTQKCIASKGSFTSCFMDFNQHSHEACAETM